MELGRVGVRVRVGLGEGEVLGLGSTDTVEVIVFFSLFLIHLEFFSSLLRYVKLFLVLTTYK